MGDLKKKTAWRKRVKRATVDCVFPCQFRVNQLQQINIGEKKKIIGKNAISHTLTHSFTPHRLGKYVYANHF